MKRQIFRGEILHFLEDPSKVELSNSYEHFEDGLLIVENGLVHSVGHTNDLLPTLETDVSITHYQNGLIMPGFIDTHVHYAQTEMIASYGEQLLGWLESYAFPTEGQYSDYDHAITNADFFLDELLKNGTTTALVFGTVHKNSVDAFFTSAQSKNLRMICGKVLMDRNAPDYLLDTPETAYSESKALIEAWHGIDRLQYAVTPRFAPTSTPEQLACAGALLNAYPDVYLHTHLAENADEVAWVESLFPDAKNYLDVYARNNLLGNRSVFAHCIHLSDDECGELSKSKSAVAYCPSSNLFIGSGLFNLKQAEEFDFKVGLGTDVGGGTSLSILETMADAYKVQQLRGHNLTPMKTFYLATLGGARALDLEGKVGNFMVGNEADFIVLDYKATSLIEKRIANCKEITEKLFVLSIMGDDRAVSATHIMGEQVVAQKT